MYTFRLCIFFIIVISGLFFSCGKEPPEESQGTNFNLLLKTVTRNNVNSAEWTLHFTYGSSGQLMATKTDYTNLSSGEQEQTETFYRNGSGRLDSTVFVSIGSGATLKTNNYFTYDAGGKLILSKQYNPAVNQTKDSSLYIYAGNVLQRRDDYRSFNGGSFTLLRRGFYTFDASGNVIQTIFQWPMSNIVDTARFEYDTKVNPLPVDRLLFYWAPFFYADYRPLNNPTLQFTNAAESYSHEYSYTSNNKPLYRKSKVINSTNAFYETWYYYD